MTRKVIILPNPISYIDYINKVLIDSFTQNIPTSSKVIPTPSVARQLVNEEGYLVLEEEQESLDG